MNSPLTFRTPPGRIAAFKVDYLLVLSTLALAVLGTVIVYSATRSELVVAGLSPHYYLNRQAGFVVIGIVTLVLFAIFDYRWLEHGSTLLYGGLILALLVMFTPIGSRALGATRWIQVGPLQLQPSAFGSLVLAISVAAFCARHPDGLERRDLGLALVLAAIPILLVVKEPDLGSGIVMCMTLLAILVVAGIPNRYLALLLVAAVLGAFAIVHLGVLKPYQVARLTTFLHQNSGIRSSAYNVHQSVAAIGSGGLWGTGLFHGPQTNLAYVPEQRTDFIFSAVGEQLGFVGSATVLALLGIISWRILHIANAARDPFGRVLGTGCFALLAFSSFENAGMSMGIMPIAGIPLPFMSYGGSATIAFFCAVGIALSIHIRHQR